MIREDGSQDDSGFRPGDGRVANLLDEVGELCGPRAEHQRCRVGFSRLLRIPSPPALLGDAVDILEPFLSHRQEVRRMAPRRSARALLSDKNEGTIGNRLGELVGPAVEPARGQEESRRGGAGRGQLPESIRVSEGSYSTME